jgi:predicted DNA-binding ArsR family transcriptional regulator
MIPTKTKVVSEVGELTSVFYAANTEIKKKVFEEVIKNWVTLEDIESKYGEEGKNALLYLEKIKLVETQWIMREGRAEKAYKSYYGRVQINMSVPIIELPDIIYAITMSEEEFRKYEEKILELVDGGINYLGDVIERLGISQTLMKGLVKRSERVDVRGHTVVRLK